MFDLTLRALAWVLRLILPAPAGRHRATTVTAPPTPPPPYRHTERLDGAAHPLVRPYVLTPTERRRQRERRRALYLATIGIDVGPRLELIHGGTR
ncbi:hypothetical protein [Streptomyces xanthii]|uniref:Uncharacterized protein n=1 Tax=Streptomyces xanthii TaxID=2768069 RepID=A0A7H1BK87_9ACTN|nr:hypothetical protein [Streptomyces xanthii]QNS09142.1 hypothetical protein IAG42_12675 [Streptomyces xanthii]